MLKSLSLFCCQVDEPVDIFILDKNIRILEALQVAFFAKTNDYFVDPKKNFNQYRKNHRNEFLDELLEDKKNKFTTVTIRLLSKTNVSLREINYAIELCLSNRAKISWHKNYGTGR